jgi:purine nucleosidase
VTAKRQLVLDTDVGIDDALMLLHIVAEPNAEIVAIGTTNGNCSTAQAAINTLKVLEAIGLEGIPVAVGAESPLTEPNHATHVHGNDGLADVDLPEPKGTVSGEHAVDQLIRLSNERPGELDLLAVGSMTNLGLAILRDPNVLDRYRSVTVLAALSHRPTDDFPYQDANVFHSPNAADVLFGSGSAMTVVPIDLTYRATLSEEHLRRIEASETPQGRLAWKILPFYCDFYKRVLGSWTASMHDPLTAGILLDPTLILAQVERPIYVEPIRDRHWAVGLAGDELQGMPARRPVTIVTDADIQRYLNRMVDALTLPLGTLR